MKKVLRKPANVKPSNNVVLYELPGGGGGGGPIGYSACGGGDTTVFKICVLTRCKG